MVSDETAICNRAFPATCEAVLNHGAMTWLLIDTSSLFFRAFYALPAMTTRAGEPTSAIYGLSVLLLKLLREVRPTGLAFARDLPGPTFRHAMYAEYKAGRPPMPDLLRPQWQRLDELIDAFGVPSHGLEGFEADDVLATLAAQAKPRAQRALIVSGDRDLFQTVNADACVHFVGARGKPPETLDEAAVAARYGVAPARMPLLFALTGEVADNLPGVAGVGAKTASKLAAQFPSGAALYANLERITPPGLRAKLESAREQVLTNESLARLRIDLPLPEPLTLAFRAAARPRVRALFEELEFKSLLPRVDAL